MKVPVSQFNKPKMEENSSSPSQANHNGQPFAGVAASLPNNNKISMANISNNAGENDGSAAKEQTPQYTMPGVLHFLQHEWARFELERSQWELDRAEYQVMSLLTTFFVYVIMKITYRLE